jgi:hypothetical protein
MFKENWGKPIRDLEDKDDEYDYPEARAREVMEAHAWSTCQEWYDT